MPEITEDATASAGTTPSGKPYAFHETTDKQFDSSIEIDGHRYGVIAHDGKPHILDWISGGVSLPLPEDVPEGFGVTRTARGDLVAVMSAGTPTT